MRSLTNCLTDGYVKIQQAGHQVFQSSQRPYLTMWSSPTKYCSSISLASVEWPTSSKLSVASAPACSSKTSSPPGCWKHRKGKTHTVEIVHLISLYASYLKYHTVHSYTWLTLAQSNENSLEIRGKLVKYTTVVTIVESN